MANFRPLLLFHNAINTSDLKPADIKYNDSWISFWIDVTLSPKPNSCCIHGCNQNDIIGGHVYIDTDLAEEVESKIQAEISKQKSLANKENQEEITFIDYRNIHIMVRNIEANRACDDQGHPLFIAPICNSCNQKNDDFQFKAGTIIVPLYESDQK